MLEFLQYDFVVRAFVAGIATAVVAPLIGMFLVVRRYALMADTLAHVSLVGVALGLLTGINPLASALVIAIVASMGMERLRESKHVSGENVLALFLSGGLAIAVVLMSLSGGSGANLVSYLFGSITTVSASDVILMIGISVLVLASVITLYKEFFFVSFNETLAIASGLPVRLLNILLMILAAMTVAISMRVVGVLLIGALMVIPIVSAIQFRWSFKKTLIMGMIFSLVSVVTGLCTSYYLDLASGGTIVVAALIIFFISLIANRGKR